MLRGPVSHLALSDAMSSDTGVHSAGERRMEAALAAADAAEGAAFFSLRFGA